MRRIDAFFESPDYKNRSIFVPYFNLCYDVRDNDADWDNVRKNLKIWRESVSPYFGGDYYPLTSVSLDSDAWIGWQFNDEEKGEGVVQMFARHDTKIVAGRFPLHGLDPSAKYEIRSVDSNDVEIVSGEELSTKGLLISIDTVPAAVIVNYKKVK